MNSETKTLISAVMKLKLSSLSITTSILFGGKKRNLPALMTLDVFLLEARKLDGAMKEKKNIKWKY